MKWNLMLLFVSTVMLLLAAVLGSIDYAFEASAIAPELARSTGINEDLLRHHLTMILGACWFKRTVFYCAPWLVLTCYFLARIASEPMPSSSACKESGKAK